MAGANKPDGKSNTQRVSFTRRDADRIGRVVRTVEAGDKKGNALTFGYRQPPPRDTFRMATFTGDSSGGWPVGNTAVVTFSDPVWGGATATAKNYFCSIGGGDVGLCRNASNVWHLVSWEMQQLCDIKVDDVSISLNTANCAIEKTIHTSTVSYLSLSFPYVTCSGQDPAP